MNTPNETDGSIASHEATTAAAAQAATDATTTALSTQSDEWEVEAASLPNKDLYVPVVDLMFDGQTKLATIRSLEKAAVDDEGRGKAVKISFEMQEELTSVEGVRKAPGYLFKPRAFVLVESDVSKRQQAEIGQRAINKLLIAAGVASKSEALNREGIYSRIGKLAGKQVLVKFSIKKSSKRDPETGEFYVNQNLAFASPEGAAHATVAAAAASNDNY
jgi:hypothetical protein